MPIRKVLYPFFVLSSVGLALSIVAHLAGLAGIELPGGRLVWALHIGIFAVWIPTVLVGIRTTRYAKRKDYWKVALSGCPLWMRRAVYVFFGYGIFNFLLFITQTSGAGHHPAGDAPPSVIRGFSGHWMIFYSAAFATLYSAIHTPQLFHERKCPNGHVVAPTAHYCLECGYAFSNETRNV